MLPSPPQLPMSWDIFGCHNWRWGRSTGTQWVETKDIASILQCTRQTSSKNYHYHPKMWIVPRLVNPAIEKVKAVASLSICSQVDFPTSSLPYCHCRSPSLRLHVFASAFPSTSKQFISQRERLDLTFVPLSVNFIFT